MLAIGNIEQHCETISTRGFVEIENAIPAEMLEKINQKIEKPLNQLTINGRRGYVESGSARFLFQTFAWCPDVVDIYTDPSLVALAEMYSGEPVHLSNHRIYRALPSIRKKMKWHLDNKIDVYNQEKGQFETTMVPDHPGLIFIAYLSDVEQGGTQLVEGSHLSVDEDREFWSEQDVAKLDGEVLTFNNRKAGTMFVYDYRCLHRAQPYSSGKVRTSIFGQFSPDSMPTGEPIFMSTADLGGLTELQKRVLNFGQAPTTENWPIGSKVQNLLSFMQDFLRK